MMDNKDILSAKLSNLEIQIIELENLHKILKTYIFENYTELMPLIECIDDKYKKINQTF